MEGMAQERWRLMQMLRRSYLLPQPMEGPGLIEYEIQGGVCLARPTNEIMYLQNTYVRAHTVACKMPEGTAGWSRKAKREWVGHMEEAWTLGRGPWRGEIDTEGELTVAYLAPTVELRDSLIEERMGDEVHVAEVHGQVTYQPWKLPAEMNAARMRERKRRPWVKVFKPSLLAAKWARGAVEHFFGPIVSEQRVDDEQREYVRYVLDGPLKNPLKSSVAVAIWPYSFEEVRVVTSETPFCEVCFTHGHMGLHGRCLMPAETLQELHEREVRSTMDPILQSNPQEERRAWHELELQVDDALRKEAASQVCHEGRRRKPAKGRGRYRRNVPWEGRGDDPMQTDDPHWLFGEDRKRKAEQGPEQEKGSKTGSSRQEQGIGGDQRERDAEASSVKSGQHRRRGKLWARRPRDGRLHRKPHKRPKCTRERQRSPLGTKGYEPRYSLRGKGKRNESPLPSGSVPLKEPSFGLPAEGVGDQSSCQEDDSSSESSTTETSDSSGDDQQSAHQSASQQQQECSAEGGDQGSATNSNRSDQQKKNIILRRGRDRKRGPYQRSRQELRTEARRSRKVSSASSLRVSWKAWHGRSEWGPDSYRSLHPQVAVQRLRHILQKLLRGNYLAHKKTGEEYAQRMEELDKGPEEGQMEEEWWAERVEVARGWREWQAEEAVKWGRRTKETWITLGERMSQQFFATVATKKAAPIMTAMDHPFDGQMGQQCTTRGILKCVTDFYRQLLTEEEQWTPEEMAGEPEQDIWSHVQSRLNLAETCKLEEDITVEEVVRAIAELPRLKTPGLDGIPAELYKELRNFFGVLLTTAYNEALKGGTLPQGFVDAYVALLFKKGAKEDVWNWRPISILNALYKILAKVLANRLKEVLPSIIDSTQTGFVVGRQILSNILLAQQILEEEQCTGQALAFVSIDLEKAYDRVRW
ncbi:hypothetical protein CBR_g37941 [Chara braunii]|uniref:Reverse transcriptase domain-containing protein n=1 Tax=Chara braunii TaxID=69332 RepID=A0A388LNY8_CHABU|nr:hypothetical protein CBR_g37941 [Chara braunii]|eukprot:GBG84066.1 hypothetical protein CBR_g37941 [Chara braunii]